MKDRFAFGKNWARFLEYLNEERILEAEKSLQEKLCLDRLDGKTFLDIGSGSGLFSLAAYRLGATVHSFDYDLDSVNCTRYLKEKYAPKDDRWMVEQGSVLDQDYLKNYAQHDIVYSWGVLHHTGNMYAAFSNVVELVKENGSLFIAIYNDQGVSSIMWKKVKALYSRSNKLMQCIIVSLASIRLWGPTFIKDIFRYANPFKSWLNYAKNNRGMSAWHDVVDWVGGYPFEVAKPEQVFSFLKMKGFELQNLKTCAGGIGCNEFVFIKRPEIS